MSPRRTELIDADWRFRLEETVNLPLALTDWVWTPGTPDQEAAMIVPGLDTSDAQWKHTSPGVSTMPENSYAWFRTTLPDMKAPGRVVHFACVDDNGTIYLNGKKLATHEGWSASFDVRLDAAWNDKGPNELVVLVQNIDGPGGLTKPVTAGSIDPHVDILALAFDDRKWRTVHLPHDYVVEGDFDHTASTDHGSLPVAPAWYRKRFHVPASDRGKSVWIYFEGVFRDASVYVNGKLLATQNDGYDPFHVDITSTVNYGADNIIAVHVSPQDFEGWWYEGGGIYRHVWLNVADPVHVIPWGVYVTSDVKNVATSPSADLTIKTELTNESAQERPIKVHTAIVDATGKQVAATESAHVLAAHADIEIVQSAKVASAALWSLEHRNLYVAHTTVTSQGKVLDTFQQTFGIRTIRFDVEHGFFLNEKPVKLQGTCNHQDFAGVGIALTDSILYWRMKTLQERLGCNAIRCSHNPMAPAMYDACDDLGLLVMDETRHPGDAVETKASPSSTYVHTEHIEKMIRRDRNHPSVIMWSMANEEWRIQGTPFGATMLTALMAAVHKHDTTRPVTTAANQGTGDGWKLGFGAVEDLYGVNYNYRDYDWLHTNLPGKPVFGSETASDTTCRGVYHTDDTSAHLTSYKSPEGSWRPLGEREFVAGGFAWTGFDYRGETSPYPWPEINSNYGILDLCGFPKDIAFYYLAWWKQDQPLVHIFPHWNWEGKEGQTVPVWCYSNCDRVELFVNGVSQGMQTMPKFGHIKWAQVVYQPGSLKAVGYRGDKIVQTTIVETTGAPAAIKLTCDRTKLSADGEDTIPVEVSIVDGHGRVVPTASNLVTFAVTGAGVNAGVGNGDPASHELNQANSRSAFAGLCMVLVKASTASGTVRLEASAPGLKGASLMFAAK